MKKRMTAAAAIVMSVCLLAGCGSGESSSVTESRADVSSAAESAAESNAESVPKKLPETDEEWHRAMIEKSLVTLGDTGPVRRKIEKAKAGEKVTVAYTSFAMQRSPSTSSKSASARTAETTSAM